MGGAVSSGRDNSDLVDNLVDAEYIVTQQVEDAFRAVDRGDYFYEAHRDSAYKDCAWRQGPLHLSAPCIYAKVAEALDLRRGLSFLNMGSGTGYLSTVIGLLLGSRGVNHGVELNAEAVAYAEMKLQEFKRDSAAIDEFDFCEPVMLVGNCLQLTGCSQYDRVYCGAACPDERVDYVKNLLKVGGIAVVPVDDKLLRIERTGEATWDSRSILSVSFATLVIPAERNSGTTVYLPEPSVMTLVELSRTAVRDVLRAKLQSTLPRPDFRRPQRAADASSTDGSDRARDHDNLVQMLFPLNRSSSSSSSSRSSSNSSGDSSEADGEHSDAEGEAIEVDEAAEEAELERHRHCAGASTATDSPPAYFGAADPEPMALQAPVHEHESEPQPPPSISKPGNTGEADLSCAMDAEQFPVAGLCKRKVDECDGAADEAGGYTDASVRADANPSSRSSSRGGGSGSSNSLDSSCSSSKRRQTCTRDWTLSTQVSARGASQCVVPASPTDSTATGAAAEAAPAAVSPVRACSSERTTSKPLIAERADDASRGAAAAASSEWQHETVQSDVFAPPRTSAEAAVKADAAGAGDAIAVERGTDFSDVLAAAPLVNVTPDVIERQSMHGLTDAAAMARDAEESAQLPTQQHQQIRQLEERAQHIRRVIELSLGHLQGGRRSDTADGSGSQGPVVVGLWRAPPTVACTQEQQRGSRGGSSGGNAPAVGAVHLRSALLETVERCDGGEGDASRSDGNRTDDEGAEFARRRLSQHDYHQAFSRSMMEFIEALPLPDALKSYLSYGRRSKGNRASTGFL